MTDKEFFALSQQDQSVYVYGYSEEDLILQNPDNDGFITYYDPYTSAFVDFNPTEDGGGWVQYPTCQEPPHHGCAEAPVHTCAAPLYKADGTILDHNEDIPF